MPEINCNVEKSVLDKGFVKLVDIMPRRYTNETLKCDESIVRAARVSYDQGSKGEAQDQKLVKYLVKHHHMVPLESVVFQFQIKCPIFVQRHIVKHRMSSMNEVSARYTEVKDEWYIPDKVRKQCTKNKQSSDGEFDKEQNNKLREQMNAACDVSHQVYTILLKEGVSREMARSVLPQSMYTSFFWKIDLRNALHFCNLRNAPDCQYETRQFAIALEDIIKETNPISYQAFRNAH